MSPSDLHQAVENARRDSKAAQRALGASLAERPLEELVSLPPSTWARLGETGIQTFLTAAGIGGAKIEEPQEGGRPSVARHRFGWSDRNADVIIAAITKLDLIPPPLLALLCASFAGISITLLGCVIFKLADI